MEFASMVEARRRAEEAVSGMADGALKVKAFEVFLARILDAEDGRAGGGAGSPAADRNGKAVPLKQKRPRMSVPESASERVLALRDEGFFGSQRGLGEALVELKNHGWVYPITSLSGTLQGLVQKGELRRMLVKDGKKRVYKYVAP